MGGGACGITREWGLRVQSAKIIFCQGAVGQEALSRGGANPGLRVQGAKPFFQFDPLF